MQTNKEKLCDLCTATNITTCSCKECKGMTPEKFDCDLKLGVCFYTDTITCRGFSLKPDVIGKNKLN